MLAYRIPGVYFEWLDTRPPVIGPRRTDIAGFVGIAARGPLHTPMKVESWIQFTSTFGGHIPQGYLAYAVEGFFANGGQTCWVVRVANPDQACPAWLDLPDDDGKPALRLIASSPGVWGEGITVSVIRGQDVAVSKTSDGKDRFSLILRLSDGGQELWRNLSMDESDERYIEKVLNDPRTGSRLIKVCTEGLLFSFTKKTPSSRMLNLQSISLVDEAGQPSLDLAAPSPAWWDRGVSIAVLHSEQDHFSLVFQITGGEQEVWRDLTVHPSDPQYVEQRLNDSKAGSRLMKVQSSTAHSPRKRPRQGTLKLHTGSNRLAYGRDGLAPSLDLYDSTGQPTLRLTAFSPGIHGQTVTVSVAGSGTNRFSLTLHAPQGKPEVWPDLTMHQSDQRYVETLLNDPLAGSRLVTIRDLGSPARFPKNTPDPQALNLSNGIGQLSSGLHPDHLSGEGTPPDKPWGLATLEVIDEVSIVAIPDIMPKPPVRVRRRKPQPFCKVLDSEPPPAVCETPPEFPPTFKEEQVRTLQFALIGHCEKLKDRVAVLDPRSDDKTREQVIGWRDSLSDQKYAALYYPWLMVPDPLGLQGLLWAIPPSGHVAGVHARGDLRVGVHKPPANEVVEGANDVSVLIDDVTHGDLNEQGVNVIRPYNGRNVRIAGARTLSRDSSWRFVNVRRLLIMIEKAINEGTQWTVFEPNNRDLWRQIDRVARSFLDGLWHSGMLDGATAEEAYFVRCDDTTNPPEETEAGRLICLIGVLPPWPAEFVIVRIGKTESGLEILEAMEGHNG